MAGSAKPSKRQEQDERKARVAQMQAAQKASERRRSVIMWSVIAVVILGLVGSVGALIAREQANRPTLEAVKSYEVKSDHVTTEVSYEQSPPVGGPHDPVWLNCGTYTQPVRKENAVHSMEHGAVWITYRPDLPADQVKKLTEMMPSTYAILSPYEGLPAPVVASGWGKQIQLTGVDDPRLKEFIKKYRQSADVPEPGAACTGGTDGTPIDQ